MPITKYHTVELDFDKHKFAPIMWAEKNCASYIGHDVFDYSDFNNGSNLPDTVVSYRFTNEADVLLFNLRWV